MFTIKMAKITQNTTNTMFGYSTWGIRTSFVTLTIMLIIILVSSLLYFTREDGPISPPEKDNVLQDHGVSSSSLETKCDYFVGKWVYDNKTYPLYKESQCTFLYEQFACEKNGRKDLSYQYLRWQPHHCDLPRIESGPFAGTSLSISLRKWRFNATTLLESLRNKRLVFVGDSLNRGQWSSMVCLVEQVIPNASLKLWQINGSLSTFKAIEYNASIEFYWAPYLVESNSDDPIYHRVPEAIVRTQAIEKHARHWTDADILVFDSYLWWYTATTKILWGTFEREDGIYKDVEYLKCYEMAIRTWSDWLEIHVNHSKTQVFWMSLSPTHERSEDWGGEAGLNCYNETQPITKQDYWGSGSDRNMMRIVEAAVDNLSLKGVNIVLLNITQLSQYRKEAHLSDTRKQREPVTEEQIANPRKFVDCCHWCLPGVPDTWNEILYAYLFS